MLFSQVNPWYEYMGNEYKGYGNGMPGYEREGGSSSGGGLEENGIGTPAGLNTNVSETNLKLK